MEIQLPVHYIFLQITFVNKLLYVYIFILFTISQFQQENKNVAYIRIIDRSSTKLAGIMTCWPLTQVIRFDSGQIEILTLKVLVTTIDALRHF